MIHSHCYLNRGDVNRLPRECGGVTASGGHPELWGCGTVGYSQWAGGVGGVGLGDLRSFPALMVLWLCKQWLWILFQFFRAFFFSPLQTCSPLPSMACADQYRTRDCPFQMVLNLCPLYGSAQRRTLVPNCHKCALIILSALRKIKILIQLTISLKKSHYSFNRFHLISFV